MSQPNMIHKEKDENIKTINTTPAGLWSNEWNSFVYDITAITNAKLVIGPI